MAPCAVFTWDDGYDCVHTYALPLFTARGATSTLYAISSLIGSGGLYMTAAHLDALHDAGWDIGNHTATHPHMTEDTEGENLTEVTTCHAWAIARGYTRGIQHFAYPYGETNATVKAQVVAAGMLTIRRVGDGQYLTGSTDPSVLYCAGYFDTSLYTLAEHKAAVDYAAANNCGALFIGHHCGCTDATKTISVDDLDALLAYCEAQGVEVLSMTEWLATRCPVDAHTDGFYVPTNHAGTWTNGVFDYLT